MKKKYSNKQIDALTPCTNVPVVGTRIPKDFYYRKHRLPFTRYTLCMPDGMICSIQVFEGENADNKIRQFIDNWYKVTKNDPELFDHFKIEEKCPICGGDMMCHINRDGSCIWCLNYPSCEYNEVEDSMKARQRICDKHGIKFSVVQKQGTKIITTNKNTSEEGRNPSVRGNNKLSK